MMLFNDFSHVKKRLYITLTKTFKQNKLCNYTFIFLFSWKSYTVLFRLGNARFLLWIFARKILYIYHVRRKEKPVSSDSVKMSELQNFIFETFSFTHNLVLLFVFIALTYISKIYAKRCLSYLVMFQPTFTISVMHKSLFLFFLCDSLPWTPKLFFSFDLKRPIRSL